MFTPIVERFDLGEKKEIGGLPSTHACSRGARHHFLGAAAHFLSSKSRPKHTFWFLKKRKAKKCNPMNNQTVHQEWHFDDDFSGGALRSPAVYPENILSHKKCYPNRRSAHICFLSETHHSHRSSQSLSTRTPILITPKKAKKRSPTNNPMAFGIQTNQTAHHE